MCSPECRRKRKASQDKARRTAVAKRPCPPDKHGTATGYTDYKCGCDDCRRWARDDQRARRAAARPETAATRRTTGRSTAKRSRSRATVKKRIDRLEAEQRRDQQQLDAVVVVGVYRDRIAARMTKRGKQITYWKGRYAARRS